MLNDLLNILYGDYYTASRIGQSVRTDIRMETAAEVRSSTQHLEERLEKLVLVTMAMWSLLRANTEMTEDDLLKRMREIDLLEACRPQ